MNRLLSVQCPYCDAPPGRPCRTSSGRPADRAHVARYDLTKRVWPASVHTTTVTDEQWMTPVLALLLEKAAGAWAAERGDLLYPLVECAWYLGAQVRENR